jgi:hypothetical protein
MLTYIKNLFKKEIPILILTNKLEPSDFPFYGQFLKLYKTPLFYNIPTGDERRKALEDHRQQCIERRDNHQKFVSALDSDIKLMDNILNV